MNAQRDVMVLDDEPIVCDRLGSSLEKAGFSVETFTDSEEAVERIRNKKFQVIVTDLKMKGKDGIEITKLTKLISPRTQVIIITGFATVDTAREALKIGAYDFIAKPFKLSQLRELVSRAAEEYEKAASAGDD